MIVIAIHFVPFDVEPGIEKFWLILHKLLQSKGSQLLLISTTRLQSSELSAIYVPYDLSSIKEVFGAHVSEGSKQASIGNVQFIENYYFCDHNEAERINQFASKFAREVIKYFTPTCILSWQSGAPLSHIFSIESKRMDIQFWSVERGWLPNTLMIDGRDNSFLSEINLSIPSARLLASYRSNEDTMQRVKSLIKLGEQGRYRTLMSDDIRMQLGLSSNTEIISVFSQLEPQMRHREKTYRESIGFLLNSDIQFIDHLSKKVSSKDMAIIVQVHPLDDLKRFDSCDNQNVHVIKGFAPIELMNLSRAMFFGGTTLISLALEVYKPIGLINRSFLSGANAIKELQDFDDIDEFIETVLTQDKKIIKQQNAIALEYLCFLYDAFLLDIASDPTVSNSGREVFAMLSRLMPKARANFSNHSTLSIDKFTKQYPTFRSLPY